MVLARLDRFNQRHPWSHNDHYGRWVVDQVGRSGARTVLDVGCGTGNLIARLRDRPIIRAAAGQELPGARIRRRLFWRYTLTYDAPQAA